MKTPIKKFSRNAFLIGFIGFALSLIIGQAATYGTQQLIGYAVMGGALTMVYFGMATHRDHTLKGKMTIGQGIKAGLTITLFAALGIALADFAYITLVNPEFFQEFGKMSLEVAEEAGDTERMAQIENDMVNYKSYSVFKLGLLGAAFVYFSVTILGAFVSIISAFLLKKK